MVSWLSFSFLSVKIESRIKERARKRKKREGEQNKISSHYHNFPSTILRKILKDIVYDLRI